MPIEETHLILTNLILLFLLKALCFLIGYFVVKLGYRLIKSGVKGEFKLKGEFSGFRADIVSASPGLLFLIVGVFLIGYAIYVPKVMELKTQKIISPPPKVALPPLPTPHKGDTK